MADTEIVLAIVAALGSIQSILLGLIWKILQCHERRIAVNEGRHEIIDILGREKMREIEDREEQGR